MATTSAPSTIRCPLCHAPLGAARTRRCGGCATRTHAACADELGVGCPTLGCGDRARSRALPGRRPPTPKSPPARPGWGAELVTPHVLSWLLFVPFPLLCLPAVAWALWRGSRGGLRTRRFAAASLLGPLVVVPALSAAYGLVGYASGTAALYTVGPRPANLDPTVRCPRRSIGCCPTGHEPLTLLPNDLVVLALGRVFGPMPGSYAGPYPAADEAFALLDRAPRVVLAPCPGTLEVEGRRVPAQPLERLGVSVGHDGPTALRAVVVEGRALVVQREDDRDTALVLDVEDGRRVAYYDRPTPEDR